jgi:hypothetical protein
VQSLPKTCSFKALFKELHTQLTGPFRFMALSTSGGVDASGSAEMVYWVDNMCAPLAA